MLLSVRSAALATVLIVAVSAQQPARSQAPAPADAAISGVVTDGATKLPIADAIVQLGWPRQREYPDFMFRQFTDSQGRYVFTDLAAGAGYVVTATKSGYFTNAAGAVGNENGSGPAIQVTEGRWVSTANVTLWPPGSISGTVTDERGEPVIGVFVQLLAQVRVGASDRWAAGELVQTDDRGMYRVGQLHKGRYFVMVPSIQSSVPVSTPATTLLRMSAQALATFQASGRPLPPIDPMIEADATTRIVVGSYPVPPPPVAGRTFTYPISFAGSTSLSQAMPIVLDAGADRTGVDIHLNPVAASRISGRVEGPPGATANLQLRLLLEGLEELGPGSEAGTTMTDADGSFVFANVPAGNYTIDVPARLDGYLIGSMAIFYAPKAPTVPGTGGPGSRIGGPLNSLPGFGSISTSLSGRTVWGRTTVSVGARDESGIVVTLRPTMTMSGRLVGETDPNFPEPAEPPRFVSLETATGNPWHGSPRSSSTRNVAAGEFAIESIVPGLYVLRGEATGWMIKSVLVNGQERAYQPIDLSSAQSYSGVVVTFTNAIPSLSGTVALDAGAGTAAVIAFPADPGQWTNYGINPVRIKTTQSTVTGAFRFRALPAGDYFVVAVPASRMHEWREPDFFNKAQPFATRVTVAWGEQKTIGLRVSDVR